MTELWWSQIESNVFTRVQYNLKRAPDAPFPKLFCTTEDQNETPSQFPTLWLHELEPIETGQDLNNTQIGGILCTFEIQVFSQSTKECKSIISQAVMQMKKMAFNVTALPIIHSNKNLSVGVARFRRMVGAGDTDITEP